MCYLWTVVGFNYYVLVYFVKYMPGTIYVNSYVLSIAELIGILLSLYLYKCLNVKLSFVVGFGISLAGGLLLLMMGSSYVRLVPIFLFLTKIGISGCLNISYIGTTTLFPTLFMGRVFGYTNLI